MKNYTLLFAVVGVVGYFYTCAMSVSKCGHVCKVFLYIGLCCYNAYDVLVTKLAKLRGIRLNIFRKIHPKSIHKCV